MVKTQIDAPGELQRAAQLLFKNWQLILPTAIASLIIGIIKVFLMASVMTTAFLGGAVAGSAGAGLAGLLTALPLLLIFVVVAALLTLLAQGVVVHAAEDVWEARPVEIGRSTSVTLGRFGPLIGAALLTILVMIIPVALCAVIIGIPLVLIVGFFLMYVVPAVILGGESASGALGESYRIARANVGPSVIALIAIIIAAIITGILEGIFQRWAILSVLASLVFGGIFAAYAALVVARFYMLLRLETPLPLTNP